LCGKNNLLDPLLLKATVPNKNVRVADARPGDAGIERHNNHERSSLQE
jgi:hypothetical protein